MDKNTLATLVAFALTALGPGGCSNKSDSSGALPSSPKRQRDIVPATNPAIQRVLTAWQEGDKSAAISRFLETDWSARPLFAPDSTFSLNEDQLKSLPPADRQTRLSELSSQSHALTELAKTVRQAGRDAAAKKDSARARKHFDSLKQCGEAIESSDSLLIIKLMGKALKNMADTELAGLVNNHNAKSP
jgi:hypothetical protein